MYNSARLEKRVSRPLTLFLTLVLAAMIFGGSFQPGAWYAGLEKPDLTPPNWLFGVVWPLLYLGMAIAATRVWLKVGRAAPLVPWGVQLVLNAAWSWLFLGLQRPAIAFVEIVVLWVAIVVNLVVFSRIDRWATGLMLPYLLWVSFASWLNYQLWQLNL